MPSSPANDFDLRLLNLLEQAQEWPVPERKVRAEAACSTGPVSASELLVALERQQELSGFLEEPAWQKLTPDSEQADSRDFELGETHLGRYRLLEVLGNGGMGQVFLAEQDEPKRQVALKLIRSETENPEAVARFLAEQ